MAVKPFCSRSDSDHNLLCWSADQSEGKKLGGAGRGLHSGVVVLLLSTDNAANGWQIGSCCVVVSTLHRLYVS